jgi:hypothetical protein
MISEERVCELCGSQIPKWKSKGTKFCGAKCKLDFREKKKATKRTTGPILHACLSNVSDPAKSYCLCKKRLTFRARSTALDLICWAWANC